MPPVSVFEAHQNFRQVDYQPGQRVHKVSLTDLSVLRVFTYLFFRVNGSNASIAVMKWHGISTTSRVILKSASRSLNNVPSVVEVEAYNHL